MKTLISPHVLQLPQMVGTVVRLGVARADSRTVGFVLEGTKCYVLIEAAAVPDGRQHVVEILVVPCDVGFELPAHSLVVGTQVHPKHGPLVCYDVTGR